jgi:hypothetical protein
MKALGFSTRLTEQVRAAVTNRTCIQEMLGLNLAMTPDILTEAFCAFPQFL